MKYGLTKKLKILMSFETYSFDGISHLKQVCILTCSDIFTTIKHEKDDCPCGGGRSTHKEVIYMKYNQIRNL